jgi:hypothetical protein
MSAAAWSMLVFGVYLAGGGAALLFLPERVCRFLVLPPDGGFWVRLNGMFFWILAYYCLRAAREEGTAFMRWSVRTRPTTLVFELVFVAMGLLGPMILLFGMVDALAALWTALALAADERRTLTAAERSPGGLRPITLQTAQGDGARDHDGP